MKGIKSVAYLQKGDLLTALAPVSAVEVKAVSFSFGSLNVTEVKFATGQTLGTVTDANRLGDDGKTYVDFTSTAGKSLSIEKTLTDGTGKTVAFAANPAYDYQPATGTGGTTKKSAGGWLDKITNVLNAVGGILGKLGGGSGTPPINGDDTDNSAVDRSAENDVPPANNNGLYWMIGGGVVLVGIIITIIVIARRRKKTK